MAAESKSNNDANNASGNSALLVIDIQADYFTACPKTIKAFPNFAKQIAELLEHARKLPKESKLEIIHTREVDNREKSVWMPWWDEMNPTKLAVLAKGGDEEFCKVLDGEKKFVKQTWDAFHGTGLHEYLQQQNIATLYMVGLETNCCILNAVLSAFNHGYRVHVIDDCCATGTVERHQNTLKLLDNVNAKVITLEQFKTQFMPLPASK